MLFFISFHRTVALTPCRPALGLRVGLGGMVVSALMAELF